MDARHQRKLTFPCPSASSHSNRCSPGAVFVGEADVVDISDTSFEYNEAFDGAGGQNTKKNVVKAPFLRIIYKDASCSKGAAVLCASSTSRRKHNGMHVRACSCSICEGSPVKSKSNVPVVHFSSTFFVRLGGIFGRNVTRLHVGGTSTFSENSASTAGGETETETERACRCRRRYIFCVRGRRHAFERTVRLIHTVVHRSDSQPPNSTKRPRVCPTRPEAEGMQRAACSKPQACHAPRRMFFVSLSSTKRTSPDGTPNDERIFAGAVYTVGCDTTVEGDARFEFNSAGTFGGEYVGGLPWFM